MAQQDPQVNPEAPVWPDVLSDLLQGHELDSRVTSWAMDQIMTDAASPVQMAGFLIGMRAKGETATEVTEVATEPIVRSIVAAGGIDVIILDGEAVPAGGMGICRSLKEEIYQCPPVLLLTARREDDWLARWSKAEATVQHPLDSIAVAHAVADLLRARVAGSAASASAQR